MEWRRLNWEFEGFSAEEMKQFETGIESKSFIESKRFLIVDGGAITEW